jgi:hypothetical protein
MGHFTVLARSGDAALAVALEAKSAIVVEAQAGRLKARDQKPVRISPSLSSLLSAARCATSTLWMRSALLIVQTGSGCPHSM